METRSMLLSRLSRMFTVALLMSAGCLSAEEADEEEAFGDSDVDFRIAPLRVCTSCTYKPVSFTGVPTTSIETASVKVLVTHAGACPQEGKPTNCTETLTYDVKCQLGSSSTVTLPILIDAASTNNNRTATLTVKRVGQSPQNFTGTLNSGSGTTTLPATPCAPPTIDPYVTFPTVL